MGKRKSSSKPQTGKKGPPPLDTVFSCVFCNNPKSVSVKMEMKDEMMGYLQCKICGQRFQSGINHLSAPIDVYTEWTDACEEAQAAHDARLRNGGGGGGGGGASSGGRGGGDDDHHHQHRQSSLSQSPEPSTSRSQPPSKRRKQLSHQRRNEDSDESEEDDDDEEEGRRRNKSPVKASRMVNKGGRAIRHESLEASDSD